MVWRAAGPAEPAAAALPVRSLTWVAMLCLATAVTALVAAGAELWRYLLLLQGRTDVLSGFLVRTSDRLVGTAAWAATALAVFTAAFLAPLLVRLHGAAAQRAGLTPSRVPAAVLARLVVPGWNLYGLGVVAGEIDGQFRVPLPPIESPVNTGPGRPRLSRLVVGLWLAWVVDAVLVLITLIRAFGTGDQAVADTVELHVFVDLGRRRSGRSLVPRPVALAPSARSAAAAGGHPVGGRPATADPSAGGCTGPGINRRCAVLTSDTVAGCPRRPRCAPPRRRRPTS